MNKVHLQKLVAEKGQVFVAKALGVSPPAISKAIKTQREILITVNDDGNYEATELRRFPSQEAPKSSTAA